MMQSNDRVLRAAAGNVGTPNEVRRTAGLVVRAMPEGAGQYELSFSSEDACLGWDGVPEILRHEPGCVDFSVLESIGGVLYHHGLDPVVGNLPVARIIRVWLDAAERKCRAVIEFDEDDEVAQKIRRKLDKGMLRGISVGASVRKWERLAAGEVSADGRFIGPAKVASLWRPDEFSLTPTPVDKTVGVGRAKNMNMEGNKMGEENNNVTMPGAQDAQGGAPAANTPPPAAIPVVPVAPVMPAASTQVTAPPAPAPAVPSADSAVVERARCAEIMDVCRSFNLDAAKYIREGTGVDQVRTEVLRTLAANNAPLPAGHTPDVRVVADEMDKVRRAATHGMLLRAGIPVAKPAEGANDFRGMTLRTLAVETMQRSGHGDANRMSPDKLFRSVLTPDSTFGVIAADVAHNAASTAYAAAAVTYPLWTQTGTFTDFRPTKVWQISAAEEPELIPQNGEFKHGSMGDEAMAVRQGVTYGKIFTLTRQAFINDDIGLLTRMPAAYVAASRRLINRLVYRILLDNPIMLDGRTLFCAEHANLGTGEEPGRASYSEARRLMRQQKDVGGKQLLNIVPKFVLSSSLDETAHELLLNSIADPSGNNSGVMNPFHGKLQLIVDAELDKDSGTQPYFFAGDPALCDTIEVASLNGEDAPKLESWADMDTLGLKYRIYDDKAVTLMDYKAFVKNPGK